VYVPICVPCMPLLRRIRATPCLRPSELNTRLVKLPCGVAWPSCPHRSFYICHNNNGHQVVSHYIIVPLNYLQRNLLKHWLFYAKRCHWVSMSSLMKLSLSKGASLFSPPKAEERSLPRCDTLQSCKGCVGNGGSLIKNPIYIIIVQTNDVKEK